MIALSIRDAVAGDADVLVAFNRALARETEHRELSADVVDRGVRRLLADPSRGRYFVAVVPQGGADAAGERIVGQLMITAEWSDWRDGWFLWIQSVYVDPAFRRAGVYRALHAHVLAHARARGDVCGVRLYVEPENARAKRTYAALGMKHSYDVMEQAL